MPRPREPISLLKAKGKSHYTTKELNLREQLEIQAETDNIICPEYLPNNLKKEFYRICNELQRINLMSNLDVEALARYITSEYQYQKNVKECFKLGATNPKYKELLRNQEKLFVMARQAANDLGLTISSRCKLLLPKLQKEGPVNKFQEFIK